MEALKASSSLSSSFHLNLITSRPFETRINKPILHYPLSSQHPTSHLPSFQFFKKPKFELSTAISSTVSTDQSDNFPFDQETETEEKDEKFDWYAHWYPVMPVCDLDKRRPHRKKVIGLDIVVWWDRNEEEWKVFDDTCPHRLAPLSEGRIDQWGRLQCVYHGWCFGGSGDCKFIPQAPRDGPPIHTSSKACVAVYPSCVQNGILWFWPNADHQYKDILSKEKPPYIAEIDDPSFTTQMMTRDIPYGYDVLVENLMDPSHVPYAHYGIMRVQQPPESVKADREGGTPLDISLKTLDKNGFTAKSQISFDNVFIAPCVFYTIAKFGGTPNNQSASSDGATEERKMKEVGSFNWNKACFVPTKADALVVAFRRWLNKYSNGQVDWGTKFSEALPPSPPKEQLMDRYWTHTVSCSSCSLAYKGLNALEIALQVVSIASIGIVAAVKQGTLSMAARNTLVSMAILCFVASKWLSHFIYKNFHFHDYNHAFR